MAGLDIVLNIALCFVCMHITLYVVMSSTDFGITMLLCLLLGRVANKE